MNLTLPFVCVSCFWIAHLRCGIAAPQALRCSFGFPPQLESSARCRLAPVVAGVAGVDSSTGRDYGFDAGKGGAHNAVVHIHLPKHGGFNGIERWIGRTQGAVEVDEPTGRKDDQTNTLQVSDCAGCEGVYTYGIRRQKTKTTTALEDARICSGDTSANGRIKRKHSNRMSTTSTKVHRTVLFQIKSQ